MSIQDFTSTLQSQIYKDWLKSLEKNIITASAKALRSKEQVSEKTSFYITKSTVKEMYKTITGEEMEDFEAQLFLRELAKPSSEGTTKPIEGTSIKINGVDAIFFKNIGFDTISTKLSFLFNTYPAIEEAYQAAETKYYNEELNALKNNPKYKTLSVRERRQAEEEISRKAKERATLGYYYNKGHVISIATNLVKQFKQEIEKADVLAQKQKKVLIEVLDKYITKLEQDDLNTANLPDAVNQELYASYIKSNNQYLVEMQHRVGNIQSGSASVPIVDELRNIFNLSNTSFASIINNSPTLGTALLQTQGSPSYIDLLVKDLVNILDNKKITSTKYSVNPVPVAKKQVKITKKSNKKEIAVVKALKNKIQSAKSNKQKFKEKIAVPESMVNLQVLQNLINSGLFEQIRKNMGTGDRRDILNYRTGRLAMSAKVERLSESREGMITAFYSYMKNPYATFSKGGRQERPTSRDPKLLISKSIRELVQPMVANRMRAVSL